MTLFPFNRQQRWQGQVDPPLNALGAAQAARLGARLAAQRAPDLVVCSDLLRARQTAAPLVAAWNTEAALDAGFREQHFGIWDGLDIATIKARHGELWPRWLEHRGDFELPGGESLQTFHRRVLERVRHWGQEHPNASIAVVTHGGVLDMLWRSARGEAIEGLRRCEIPNTGLNVLQWDGAQLEIRSWADAEHLRGLPEPAPTVAGER